MPLVDLVDQIVSFVQHLAGAEHRAVVLHHMLHAGRAVLPWACRRKRQAVTVEPAERLVG